MYETGGLLGSSEGLISNGKGLISSEGEAVGENSGEEGQSPWRERWS